MGADAALAFRRIAMQARHVISWAKLDFSRNSSGSLIWYFALEETGHSEEFKRDAVRIALTRGLTCRQVASDLGMGVSTLKQWIRTAHDSEDASLPYADLVREVERLRKEVVVLKPEREILKKDETLSAIGPRTMVECLLRAPRAMRFVFIDRMKKAFPIEILYRVMKVTSRGVWAWRSRPMSQCQP